MGGEQRLLPLRGLPALFRFPTAGTRIGRLLLPIQRGWVRFLLVLETGFLIEAQY